MIFSFDWDEAIREDKKYRKKKEEKRQKLLAVINDPASTEGEKDNARRLLEKL